MRHYTKDELEGYAAMMEAFLKNKEKVRGTSIESELPEMVEDICGSVPWAADTLRLLASTATVGDAAVVLDKTDEDDRRSFGEEGTGRAMLSVYVGVAGWTPPKGVSTKFHFKEDSYISGFYLFSGEN